MVGFCYEKRVAPGGVVGDGAGNRFLCGTRRIPWLMLTHHLPLNDQPRNRKMIHQGECGSGFDKIYDVDLNPSECPPCNRCFIFEWKKYNNHFLISFYVLKSNVVLGEVVG